MRSEAEVGGSETFIQTSHAFLLQRLRETVPKPLVQYALQEKSTESEINSVFTSFINMWVKLVMQVLNDTKANNCSKSL